MTWLKPPSSSHACDAAVIHTESMPSASWTCTEPAIVSVRLATTVVSSIVKESCGGPGRPRSPRQAAASVRANAPGIWQSAFREMRSVLLSYPALRPAGQSDSPRAADLRRDSSPGLDRPLL